MKLQTDLDIKYLIKKNKNIEIKHVFLIIHGYGSNEHNLLNIFINSIPDNFIIISIRGIYTNYTHKNSYYWYEIDTTNNEKIIINNKQIIYSKNKIINFIKNIIHKYNLQSYKIWLCGFSQGAVLANIIALNNIININYVLSLCGFIPNNIIIKNNKTNFFISHGIYDNIISINLYKKMIQLLNQNKINITNKMYNMGHEINQENYKDIIGWIYMQIKNYE